MAVTQQLARVTGEHLATCSRSVDVLDRLCSFDGPDEDYLDLDWAPRYITRALILSGAPAAELALLDLDLGQVGIVEDIGQFTDEGAVHGVVFFRHFLSLRSPCNCDVRRIKRFRALWEERLRQEQVALPQARTLAILSASASAPMDWQASARHSRSTCRPEGWSRKSW